MKSWIDRANDGSEPRQPLADDEVTREYVGRERRGEAGAQCRDAVRRPAVKACIEVLGDEQGDTIHRVALELHSELALLPLEALTADDVAEILRKELARVYRS